MIFSENRVLIMVQSTRKNVAFSIQVRFKTSRNRVVFCCQGAVDVASIDAFLFVLL